MKILLIICSLCIAGTLGYTIDSLMKYTLSFKEACIRESGVDPAVVEDALKGNPAKNDLKLQCCALCLSRNIKLTDGKGEFQQKEASPLIPTDSVPGTSARVTGCGKLTGKNSCEQGYNILSCFLYAIRNAKKTIQGGS